MVDYNKNEILLNCISTEQDAQLIKILLNSQSQAEYNLFGFV